MELTSAMRPRLRSAMPRMKARVRLSGPSAIPSSGQPWAAIAQPRRMVTTPKYSGTTSCSVHTARASSRCARSAGLRYVLDQLQRLAETGDRFRIGRAFDGALARLSPISYGRLGEAGLGVVMGQAFELFGQAGRVDLGRRCRLLP